ncbi:hypothetical protein [Klenkia sp. PcliD-1-E]|uniref:hypothetical protein n=1 Tax=Klenkia sp. PcliD-1-E TaxID=2954492 RepID=UPI002097F9B2|nr:hypothetical protein [Klenkia sp. PcliD-1-E]MCO7220466.1 hypothetical protein [Klenkia sp. PcliD-1-E]
MQFAGREPETDVSAGRWVADAVRPGLGVAGLLPPLFPAAARVFHPAAHYVGDDDVDVRWAEVAAANGTTAHPLMEWGGITGSLDFYEEADQSPVWEGAPARGHLPEQVAGPLAEVLARHTQTPDDCFFGVWDGFGFITAPQPRLTAGARSFWLVRGPVTLAAANMAAEPWEQGASLWWPADRAWCVATDVELVSTYLVGSAACVADVLGDPRLETAAASATQPVGDEADTVNPPPD